MSDVSTPRSAGASTRLNVSLWAAQVVLAVTLAGGGAWKIATPFETVAATFPWAGETGPGLLYASAVFDVLGGLGVLLPSLTRIAPRLTVLAALGVVVLMVSATVFHLARGEAADTPLNIALAAVALVVAWGRHARVPIAPRS